MLWLTDKSRIEQSNECNNWYLLDNELFMDMDNTIYLTPRGFKTDNYTIPDWVAWICGSKAKWDVRASHLHDFGCLYHKLIKVNLPYLDLMKKGLLKVQNHKFICYDIPIEYLELIDVKKWDLDCLFKRAMKASGDIPERVYNTFRCGVFFNIGWVKYEKFDFKNIYKKLK